MKRALTVLVLAACAHAPPPAELNRVRDAYHAAARGYAGTYASVDLEAARTQLNLAYSEHEAKIDPQRVADRAYVASRKIDLANANASIARENRRLENLAAQARALRARPLLPDVAPPPPPPPARAAAGVAP